MKQITTSLLSRCLIFMAWIFFISTGLTFSQEKDKQRMDEMWGDQSLVSDTEDPGRGRLFHDGNYAMFVHWGLYSQLAGNYEDSTYYGISEWIMSPRRANIPVDKYKELARDFNPVAFDAEAIAKLAKDAGMKYIIHTSKHHDGFAMYHSKACDFNIVDATPFRRDPVKELADACREEGIGFGFYYSQNQDWTAPGGDRGPTSDASGKDVSFDDYFNDKCIPQVEEITTQFGDIVLIWFDTPGKMPKIYAEKLIDIVHRNQPEALVSSRVGHGLGDYRTLGDMEIPHENVEGPWEAVDVTNDSWGYAAYDRNWKSPKDILCRLISTVARGGTYMLNIGPKGDGSVPENAAQSLRTAGKWIKRYPQVIYAADPSPWQHALPWGDVTVKGTTMYVSVFDWPGTGELFIPGLKSEISAINLLNGDAKSALKFRKENGWIILDIPFEPPEKFVSVIEVELDDLPEVDPLLGLDPDKPTHITAHFAETKGCQAEDKRWMEKFGEWIKVKKISHWEQGGKATWEVSVYQPGNYLVELTYAGKGRLVLSVETDEGEKIHNEQNSSHIFTSYPIGWLKFDQPGKHKVSVSLLNGDPLKSELSAITFTRVDYGD